MNRIKIGIMTKQQIHQRNIDISAGRYVPKSGDPKIWFSSMKLLATVLSDNNRLLLKVIEETEPETIQELATITGRHASNLGRTLKVFEHYGFVKMVKNQRSKKPVVEVTDFDICIPA